MKKIYRNKLYRYSFLTLILLASAAAVYAASVPNTFTSGSTVLSSEVNDNFDYLAERVWEKSGSDLYYNSGNVGIGTTTPATTLDVNGTVTATAFSGPVSNITDGTIVDADINTSAAIDATKIADGTVTSTEFQYLGSVTSDIQTQLDSKGTTITGSATTIDTESLTASMALISNASQKVAVSSVTDTELAYVSGVTSAIQTQLDAKAASGANSDITSIAPTGGSLITLGSAPGNDLIIGTDKLVVEGDTGNVGIGTAGPNDALDVVGDIDATGCFQNNNTGTMGGTCVSDGRFKENIIEFSGSLEKLSHLKPVYFDWKDDESNVSGERGSGVGLIAQEVEKVFPPLVTEDIRGYKRIRYDIEFQMHLIVAVRELKAKNDALIEQNNSLDKRLRSIEERINLNL